MKKVFLFLFFVYTACQPLEAQWASIKPVGAQHVWDVSVVDDQTAFALSGDSLPLLYQTHNGGAGWQPKPLPVWDTADPYYWQGVRFLDSQTGYVFGNWLVGGGVYNNGTESFLLFKTTDGGDTWTDLTPQVPSTGFAVLEDMHFFNNQQGVCLVITGLGYTLAQTTDDGGLNWQTRDTLRQWVKAAHFRPDGSGVAILYNFHNQENALALSADFGNTWVLAGTPGSGPDWPQQRLGLWYDDMLFVDDKLVYRIWRDPQDIGPHDDLVFLDESNDGGQSWQIGVFTTQDGEFIHALKVLDNSVWIQTWTNLYRHALVSGTGSPAAKPVAPTLSPNPVAGGANCRLSTTELASGPATLRICSADGRVLQTQAVTCTSGVVEFIAPHCPPGFYQISLEQGGKSVGAASVVFSDFK